MSVGQMFIDGQLQTSPPALPVINPATGEQIGYAPNCAREQLDQAFMSAERAFASWRLDEGARRSCLADAAQRIVIAADELARILTAEQGKPLSAARREIEGAAAWFEYFATLELPREIIRDDERSFVEIVRRPLGVVAAITPWNFPIMLGIWKLAPAMIAGNTVVLKPSPFTPLTTLRLGEILQGSFPPGVLNVISGDDEVGRGIVSHRVPRKISFTGSVAAGKHVAASAATDLKRVTLELGGNDPAIVLDDADVSLIAKRIFWGAFENSGQVCSAIKRVYVAQAMHDDLVDALADIARKVRVGDGAIDGTQLGPISNRPQFERVSSLVEDALQRGAKAAAGGHPLDRPGNFFAPTVLVDAPDGTAIVDEEQFGPALPIIAYGDVEEALERANGTNYGLGASVWSSDPDRAAKVAARIDCGTAWINTHLALAPWQPFGGAKWSGIGVENGSWGLLGFSELQVLHRAKSR